MIRSSYLLLCLALTASLPAGAGVYTYIDAQGNQVFTDQPRRGDARELQLAPANQAVPTQVIPRPLLAPGQPPAPPEYDRLRILLPEPDSTLNDGTGNMLVTVTSEPGLRPGHLFRLLLDDQPQGAPSASPVFSLQNLDRGTHQLAVEIIDRQGLIVERTPSQPVHIKRTSLAMKRQANPCKKGDWGVRPECPLSDKPAPKPKPIPFLPFGGDDDS